MSRGSPCFSIAGVPPHQNTTASVRSFWASHSKPRQQTHQQHAWNCNTRCSSCLGLSSAVPKVYYWACPARVEHDRWHVAERCKILTAQLPYDFIRELSVCNHVLAFSFCNEVEGSRRFVSHSTVSIHHSLLWHCCSCLTALSDDFAVSPHTCRDGHAVLRPSVKSIL